MVFRVGFWVLKFSLSIQFLFEYAPLPLECILAGSTGKGGIGWKSRCLPSVPKPIHSNDVASSRCLRPAQVSMIACLVIDRCSRNCHVDRWHFFISYFYFRPRSLKHTKTQLSRTRIFLYKCVSIQIRIQQL